MLIESLIFKYDINFNSFEPILFLNKSSLIENFGSLFKLFTKSFE